MKKLLALIVVALLVLGGCAAVNESVNSEVESPPVNSAPVEKPASEPEPAAATKEVETVEEAKDEEKSVPREYKAALKKAELYSETMYMSKAGIYDQLTSEFGENFPKEAAQYAIDNIVADWKENALQKAKTYAEAMSMSDADILDQLVSEHGEKFTKEEAQYAVDNLE